MKKLIFILLIISSLFADYKISLYSPHYGHSSNRIIKTWIAKDLIFNYRPIPCLKFTEKNTGKKFYIQGTYIVEEL